MPNTVRLIRVVSVSTPAFDSSADSLETTMSVASQATVM